MRKFILISMLFIGICGHCLAYADIVKPNKPRSLNNCPKAWVPKAITVKRIVSKPDIAKLVNVQNEGLWRQVDPGNFGLGSELPGAGGQLLLNDGSIMVFNYSVPNLGQVWKLTPDIFGNYESGTWTQLASLNYAPLYYASAVLADGRVIVMGGEYSGPDYDATLTSQGAIYDPQTNVWTPVSPPPFFGTRIGDAQSVILEDGTFMLATIANKRAALLDLKTMTWTETGSVTKWDVNDEEGWTLLPNGKVLTVDATGLNMNPPFAEITTNKAGVGPFVAYNSPRWFANKASPISTPPFSGPAKIATPDPEACTPIDDLSGHIGVCYRSTICNSQVQSEIMIGANALAVIAISENGNAITPGGDDNIYYCSISEEDGATLTNAITTFGDNLKVTINVPTVTRLENNYEIYNPRTGVWKSAGNTIVPLSDPIAIEQGPGVLMADGKVFWAGGLFGNTAIYDYKNKSWAVGPTFPFIPGEGQLGVADCLDRFYQTVKYCLQLVLASLHHRLTFSNIMDQILLKFLVLQMLLFFQRLSLTCSYFLLGKLWLQTL